MNIRYCLLFVLLATQGHAQSFTSVSVSLGTKQVVLYCKDGQPGKVSGARFKSLAQQVKTLKVKAASDRRYRQKLKDTKKLLNLGKAACARIAIPPPAPPSATPTSTPLPTNQNYIFDSQGNLTTLGKSYLGVPADLDGNIDRGQTVQNFFCAGCHAETRLWRYVQLKSRIQAEPMYFQVPGDLSTQQVADLVAYLNRFQIRVP